jgi:hypothetical protein
VLRRRFRARAAGPPQGARLTLWLSRCKRRNVLYRAETKGRTPFASVA